MALLKSTMFQTIIISLMNIIIGFLIFKENLFEVNHPGFGFIMLPIIGSIVFSLFINNRKRDLIFVVIILFLLDIFMTKTFKYQMIFIHLVFIVFLIIGISLHANFFDKLKNTKHIRPLVLAALLAITLPLANTLLWFTDIPGNIHRHLFLNLPYGFVMGLSIGIGLEISQIINLNKYSSKIWKGRNIF